jgi:gliding motility-associated-like protein
MNTTTINYYNTSQVGIIAVPNDGCNPLDVTLNFSPANLIANGTWSWQFGDYYSNINTSTDSTATHLYQHEGNFIVTFNGLDINGCAVTATTNVDVYIKPNADFYNTPEVGYSQDPTITFVDLSYGANYWIWDFGDPGSYNDNFAYNMNPVHVFSDSGTYTVMLVVMSSHNCSDTAYHDVVIYPEPIVYIPNAFTPNSDRLNDVFRPIITGFDKSTYKFYIFDRWGREVFFSNDVYTGWDGKHKGKPIEMGVFSYIVYFNEYTGKEHKIIGSVTLIR